MRTAVDPVEIGLNAAIFAVRGEEPVVAVVPTALTGHPSDGSLPCGPFSPREHGTLEGGLRSWVHRQTGIELGFAQQLCTFGDRIGPPANAGGAAPVVVTVCYLALAGPAAENGHEPTSWQSWYAYFPWEDWRHGRPDCLANHIEPHLRDWAARQPSESGWPAALDRGQRLRLYFGCDGGAWDEEKVLERYELLCEAGLIGQPGSIPGNPAALAWRLPKLWHQTQGDHARVLATAIGEFRRAIKYRPAVFELMAEVFTLFELQKTVEAILGPHLHKQNFRRLVEGGGLVEPTGEYRYRTGGRPAQLYRFRRDVMLERLAPGVRVKAGRA
ncbi:MAG: NAD regulator [Hyphomicrobiaceae bacterium]|nr:MAG: NAD regulator [Hyphomicrobiaceae bacterium]